MMIKIVIKIEAIMNKIFNNPDTASIRYIVDDLKSCVTFYKEILGFEVGMNPPNGFAMLSKGNLRLLLNEPGAGGAGQAMPDGTVPEPGGWNRMQLQTQDIQAAIEYLRHNEIKFRNELIVGNGGKQILVLDPSGNLVELIEPSRH
jgi:catechol 2,3-dioxygenase-like lactoylglutathione lyase family enzyme